MEPTISMRSTDDLGRWYTSDGVDYPSVTTILDCVQPKQLTNWRNKTSPAQIQRISDHAKRMGSELHAAVEHDLKNQPYQVADELKIPYENWLQLKAAKQIRGIFSEQMVVSKKYGFAGSLDIFGTFEGKYAIMDLKTGRSYSVMYGWQMAAYREAFLENHKYKPEEVGMVGIKVPRDGQPPSTFVYEHIDFCFGKFLHSFEVWKGLNYHSLAKRDWPYLNKNSYDQWRNSNG